MTLPEPYYDADGVTIYHADCLDVIADLSIDLDAVITDPPYASGTRLEAGKVSSGAMLRGQRFASRPIDLDQMTTLGFTYLMRSVALGCYPLLPDGASFASFIDWRQWPPSRQGRSGVHAHAARRSARRGRGDCPGCRRRGARMGGRG